MDPDLLAALRTPRGAVALAEADRHAGDDPLTAASALRTRGIPADLGSAALTQALLRRRAATKFGPDAAAMFFTRAGLEQATRGAVAARRAARLVAGGVRTLADLGCGIGSDALACARAGIRVYAAERDPATAAIARANAEALGLATMLTVTATDAEQVDLSGVDGVFCDPARRSGTGRRVFDPSAYSPPWDFVVGLAERVPRAVLKVAPGIDHALLPAGCEAQWVSVSGEVVEAAIWSAALAQTPRRATLLGRTGEVAELTGAGTAEAPVSGLRGYLYDPDGAVVRAHLVAEFAETVGGGLADPTIAYVYADHARATPYARCLRVLDAMPFSLKRLRAELRRRGVGRLTIAKRGSAVEPEQLRRDLRLRGDEELTVVLTRVAGAQTVLLCEPAPTISITAGTDPVAGASELA